jgi:hypothetical protein
MYRCISRNKNRGGKDGEKHTTIVEVREITDNRSDEFS